MASIGYASFFSATLTITRARLN